MRLIRTLFRDRLRFALAGALLGIGAPLGWLLVCFIADERALLLPWLRGELLEYGDLYAYLTATTITVFSLFGFGLGRRSDRVTEMSHQVEERLKRVNVQAATDVLTQIHNNRFLHEQLSLEIEASKRYQTPLSCIMIDIDDFKGVNDTYGHPSGDAVLTGVAKILSHCVRRVDLVGRLGGEEFLVILPHTSQPTAATVAERIRRSVENHKFDVDGRTLSLTVSIGVAAFPSGFVADKSSLLKTVDEALYRAKRGGKNRVVIAQEPAVPFHSVIGA